MALLYGGKKEKRGATSALKRKKAHKPMSFHNQWEK